MKLLVVGVKCFFFLVLGYILTICLTFLSIFFESFLSKLRLDVCWFLAATTVHGRNPTHNISYRINCNVLTCLIHLTCFAGFLPILVQKRNIDAGGMADLISFNAALRHMPGKVDCSTVHRRMLFYLVVSNVFCFHPFLGRCPVW